MTWKCYL